MKRIMAATFLMLIALSGARADSAGDAFNAGAAFGKDNKGQGIPAAKKTDPSTVIPGFTSAPPQSGYYGGVKGGDGGIKDRGQTALGKDDAGQAIIRSGTTNPAVKIDPKADFIQNGKGAEANSGTIVDGTSAQCTAKVVSKSVFESYRCDRDVAQVQTCARTGTPSGNWTGETTTRTVIISNSQFTFSRAGEGWMFSFISPVAGTLSAGTLTFGGNVAMLNQHISFMNTTFNIGWSNGTFALNVAGMPVSRGQQIASGSTCFGDQGQDCRSGVSDILVNDFRSGKATLTLTLTVNDRVFHPQVTWNEVCGFDKQTATAAAGSVCTAPGGTRTVTAEGRTYPVTRDCWQFTDSYVVPVNSTGNCGTLMADKNCTVAGRTCQQSQGSACLHEEDSYQCQKTYSSQGLLCGGNYLCQSGSCDETNGAGDSGFDTAVAKLAGLASAGEDVKNGSQVNVKAFTGQAMSCRKAFAGFSNCCVDTGWGNSAGLAHCSSDEMALGKAKAKKVTVSVGDKCDHAVLGVCVQKSQVYCVFQGKLARIIQEQGRRDQLHVSFGSGGSPDCRGITVPELQAINFDLINFRDFYSDLMASQKIPDSATMVKQAKDRIAAQVAAQTGGKK